MVFKNRGLRTATWTPLYWKNPEKHLDPETAEDIPLLRAWTDEQFTWERDPVFGILDVCRSVEWIIENGRGDCVDHSAVALSWLISRDFEDISLMFCFDVNRGRWGGHLVAVSDGFAYDTDGVHRVEEYTDRVKIQKPIDKEEFR